MDMTKVKTLAKWIEESQASVFFGGAGVSTESGISDFRSKTGIYSKHIGAESILTPRFMLHEAKEFWSFYRTYLMPKDPQPNACHYGLAELEKAGLLKAVITQNIDGLHQAAGSKNVLELHGNGQRFYCVKCGKESPLETVVEGDLIPLCPYCHGQLRPDIVLYEEALDFNVIESAAAFIAAADLIIIGGTSLTVYPAAGLLYERKRNSRLVLINKDATFQDDAADILIRDPIGEVFKALMPLLNLPEK